MRLDGRLQLSLRLFLNRLSTRGPDRAPQTEFFCGNSCKIRKNAATKSSKGLKDAQNAQLAFAVSFAVGPLRTFELDGTEVGGPIRTGASFSREKITKNYSFLPNRVWRRYTIPDGLEWVGNALWVQTRALLAFQDETGSKTWLLKSKKSIEKIFLE